MITYTKLRNGNWGIKSDRAVVAGEVVTVTKKDQTTKTETIEAVVFAGNGAWICAVRATGTPAASASSSRRRGGRATRTGCRCGSVEEYEKDSDCSSCRHDR